MRARAWLILGLLAPAAGAQAHPLGNFTVNHLARVSLTERGARLHFVADMAEIPAFQERALLDPDGDGDVSGAEARAYGVRWADRLRADLTIAVDGHRLPLSLGSVSVAQPDGQGGLKTLRLVAEMEAKVRGPAERLASGRHTIEISNQLDAGRLGWHDVVLGRSGPHLNVLQSTAASADPTVELTSYPTSMLTTPPERREARVVFEVAAVPSVAPLASAELDPVLPAVAARDEERPTSSAVPPATRPASPPGDDRFTALIHSGGSAPSLSFVLTALLVAAGLGGAHALSPGHGKTVVGAYLVGARGTTRDAVFLGAVVTFTHTVGVFVLGLLAMFASRYILPERLYPWLGCLSGALVALIGAGLFHERLERLLGITGTHRHLFWTHSHEGPGSHSHVGEDGAIAGMPPDGRATLRSLVGLGVSGGIVPCPSAIVVLLSAVALHRIGFGLLLIVAFSAGLATVLIAIGLLFVHAARFMSVTSLGGWPVRALPVVSALAVTALGLAISVQSLVAAGIVRIPRL